MFTERLPSMEHSDIKPTPQTTLQSCNGPAHGGFTPNTALSIKDRLREDGERKMLLEAPTGESLCASPP